MFKIYFKMKKIFKFVEKSKRLIKLSEINNFSCFEFFSALAKRSFHHFFFKRLSKNKNRDDFDKTLE